MFEKIIKIPNKSFSDLSLVEVASMIEADSAIQPKGNSEFSSCALDEFLHATELKHREDLKLIQETILKNIYIDIPGEKHKEINVDYLKNFVAKLRDNGLNDL